MTANYSPIGNGTLFSAGAVAAGYQLFSYAAGTTTKQSTYTDYNGTTANTNPIVLNAYGQSANTIWLTDGLQYKFVLAPPADTDPPTSGITLGDYIEGINETQAASSSSGSSQWIDYSGTVTYVSSTQFSVTGDQTATFLVNRRTKTVNTSGTVYSTITVSSYSAGVTTVTVQNDLGVIDSGLSSVAYGIITALNTSLPPITLLNNSSAVTQTTGDNSTKVATDAFVQQEIAAATASISSGSVGIKGAYSNLSVSTTGSTAAITVTADEILTTNGSGAYHKASSVSLTISGASAGANGIDTGTIAASTWYYLFVIWNSGTNTTAGLMSLSPTAPTMPAGYAYFARCGAVLTDGTANKYPLSIVQKGNKAQYKVVVGSNTPTFPLLGSGVAGDRSIPTYVAVAASGGAPATAGIINIFMHVSNSYAICSPSNATGNSTSTTNPPYMLLNSSTCEAMERGLILQSSNVYWAGDANSYLRCSGWEDNL